MLRQICFSFLILSSAALAHQGKYHQGKGHDHVKTYHPKQETIEVPECPEGYVSRGGSCMRPENVPKEVVCPEGTVDDGEECVVIANGTPVCPEGIYVGNLFCEATEMTEGRLQCPVGSIPENDQCFVGGLLTYCPVGSAPLPSGQCEQTYPKQYFCAAGLKDTGSLCLETQIAPVEKRCPEDTKYVDGKCVVEVQRERVCPQGYSDEGEQCATFQSPARDTCPYGYTFEPEALSCVKTERTKSEPECSEGGVLVNGKCEMIAEGPFIKTCDSGILIDGYCRVVENLPVQYECPEGYEVKPTPKGPVCVAQVEYDCSTTMWKCKSEPFAVAKPATHTKSTKAPSPKFWKNPSPKSFQPKLRHLTEKSYSNGHDHEVHHGFCEKEEVRVPKKCEKTVVAEPKPYCMEGEYTGNSCVVVSIYPARDECLGVEREGQCVLIETYNPVYVCPSGYSPVGDGTYCEQVDIVAPAESCPSGTVEFQGLCAIFVEKECPPEGCEDTITWAPEDVCPFEFELVRAGYMEKSGKWSKTTHHEKVSKKCIKQTYYPKESVCPPESQPFDETTCVSYVPPVTVNDDKTIPPQFICPVGYAVTPRGCVMTSFQTAVVECPAGYEWILDTEMCAREEPTELECPKGSRPVGDECIVEVSVGQVLVPKHVLKVPIDKKTAPKKYITTSTPKFSKKPFWKW